MKSKFTGVYTIYTIYILLYIYIYSNEYVMSKTLGKSSVKVW